MRWLILLCFLVCLVPAAHAYDCPPGTHFVPDGVFIGVWWTDPATGNTEFIVEEEGDCVSDCYPYECCDSLKIGIAPPAAPALPRRKVYLVVIL